MAGELRIDPWLVATATDTVHGPLGKSAWPPISTLSVGNRPCVNPLASGGGAGIATLERPHDASMITALTGAAMGATWMSSTVGPARLVSCCGLPAALLI